MPQGGGTAAKHVGASGAGIVPGTFRPHRDVARALLPVKVIMCRTAKSKEMLWASCPLQQARPARAPAWPEPVLMFLIAMAM